MKLVDTLPARGRIVEIEDHYSDSVSRIKAHKIISKLLEKALTLKEHPLRRMMKKHLFHRGKGHRSLLVGRSKIIYYVNADTIFITDLFDTKQDISRLRG